jgi:hypothetical protein
MPGFNQRGPDNEGPMTGGRRGICTGAGYVQGGFSTPGPGRGRGWRCAQGQGFGLGRGFGRPAPQAPLPDAREALARRAELLEQELSALRRQIAALDAGNE